MSERTGFFVRNGLVATAGFAVLVLLMLFYSTVSGAVDRAQQRRAEIADNARLSKAAGAIPDAPRVAALIGATR